MLGKKLKGSTEEEWEQKKSADGKEKRKNGHKATKFVIYLFTFGFVLFVLGGLLERFEFILLKFLGILFLQIAGTLMIASVAIVFFNLKEIQDQISAAFMRFFTTEEIMTVLSETSKKKIEQNIVKCRIADTTCGLKSGLFDETTKIRDQCMQAFCQYNYCEDIVVDDDTDHTQFCIHECVRTFRLSSKHLATSLCTFPLRYVARHSIPSNLGLTAEDFLLEFKASAGDVQFSKDDVDRTVTQMDGRQIITIEFKKDISVHDTLDIMIAAKELHWKDDNVLEYYVRYPTCGFSVCLRYHLFFQYNATWFKATKPGIGFEYGDAFQSSFGNGIKAFMNGWVLPGEGVVISWFPKHLGEKKATGKSLFFSRPFGILGRKKARVVT